MNRPNLRLFVFMIVVLAMPHTISCQTFPSSYLQQAPDTAAHKKSAIDTLTSDTLQKALIGLMADTRRYLAPKAEKKASWNWLIELLTKLVELTLSIFGILVGIPGLRKVIKNKFKEEGSESALSGPDKVREAIGIISILLFLYFLGSTIAGIAQTILLGIFGAIALLILLAYVFLQYWKFIDPYSMALEYKFTVTLVLNKRYTFNRQEMEDLDRIKQSVQDLVDQMDSIRRPVLIFLYVDKPQPVRTIEVFIQCDDPKTRDILEMMISKFLL